MRTESTVDIAEAFSTYYLDAVIAKNLQLPGIRPMVTSVAISHILFDVAGIMLVRICFNMPRMPGPDGIPPVPFRTSNPGLPWRVLNLFSFFMSCVNFRPQWKISITAAQDKFLFAYP